MGLLLSGDAAERRLRHGSVSPSGDPERGAMGGFRSRFSLGPLVEHWRALAAAGGEEARRLVAEVDRHPEVAAPVSDGEVYRRHAVLVDALLTAVVPSGLTDRVSVGMIRPFDLEAVFATPRFRATLLEGTEDLQLVQQYRRTFEVFGPISPHLHVLERVHGVRLLDFERAYILSRPCGDGGLEEHVQVMVSFDFVDVRPRGPVSVLAPETLDRLTHDFSDVRDIFAIISPDAFEFEGFTLVQCMEISMQESVNQLRDAFVTHDLLDADELGVVQRKARSALRVPSLHLAIGVHEGDQMFFTRCGQAQEDVLRSLVPVPLQAAEEALAGAVRRGGMRVVDDLWATPQAAALRAVVGEGARSVLAAPLELDGAQVGMLLLSSPFPGEFSALIAVKVSSLVPLISRTVKRTHDAVNLQVQAVIKERYTSIHPSVEWRFREAVWHFLRGGRTERLLGEDIVFPDVYPLFGISDIRSSSIMRNRGVQADLLEQLDLALDALRAAYAASTVPLLDHLLFQLDDMRARVEAGLTSGDEVAISEFLRRDVEAVLPRLEVLGENVASRLARYREALDPRLGILYQRRQAYEESVLALSDLISGILMREQERVQPLFPHYFEMHKSDGVDHGMYTGQSMLEHGRFDAVFLRSLRLWQMVVMCEVARAADALRPTLRVPLETTHLVLVQHAPLSIRFSTSEKQFNVDGAYNVRYEIVKKRLDKAVVRGSGERLTQPGKLAVVYTHPREADEYRGYLHYLEHRGQVEGDVEELELDELPGAQGLRALRVQVRMETAEAATAELLMPGAATGELPIPEAVRGASAFSAE